jgi:Tol biopolymer transport system component
MRSFGRNVFWCAVLPALCLGAWANDGSGNTGAGGGVFLQQKHRTVRMVSEEVHIQLPQCRVRTRFLFKNEGPATTVLMIFPENGYLNTATEEFEREVRPRYTHFKYFRAFVDGKPVRVRRIVRYNPSDPEGDPSYYEYWWAKWVHFARGQTRVVVNRYQGGLGWGGLGFPERTFRYILGTGASWKGRIERARIVCDVRGIRDGGPVWIEPAGYRRRGDRIAWEFRAFTPKRDQDLSVAWVKGFVNVRVNGQPVYDRSGWKWEWGPIAARREGREVWLPLRAAADWLGARLMVVKPERGARLTRGDRWAEVLLGSPTIATASGRRSMPGPARADPSGSGAAERGMVAFRPLVKALGGTASFDHTGRLLVRMPPIPPATAKARNAQAAPVRATAGLQQKVLFVSGHTDKMKLDLFTMLPDGSQRTRLTSTDDLELDPVWSPDGRQIAFAAVTSSDSEDDPSEIFAMNADGSHRRQLTRMGDWAFAPAWSPDGKRLAFTVMPSEDDEPLIYRIDADGRNLTRLGKGAMPSWSPNGSKLLYTGHEVLKSESSTIEVLRLCVMDAADGKNTRRLTDQDAMMGAWSPDGKRIAYIAASVSEQGDLFVMNADGSRRRQLTRTKDSELGPQWSADGRRIFFTRFPGQELELHRVEISLDRAEIYVMDADGRNVRRLTNNDAFDMMSGTGFLVPLLVAAALSLLP